MDNPALWLAMVATTGEISRDEADWISRRWNGEIAPQTTGGWFELLDKYKKLYAENHGATTTTLERNA